MKKLIARLILGLAFLSAVIFIVVLFVVLFVLLPIAKIVVDGDWSMAFVLIGIGTVVGSIFAINWAFDVPNGRR